MKRIFFYFVFVVVMTAWCMPSFAVQTVLSGGAAPGVNLSSTGISDGVWMSTSSGGSGADTFLNVLAGDSIFTGNSSGGNVTNPLLSAAYATDADFAYLNFNGDSDVFGTIGVGATFMDITLTGGSGTTVNFWGTTIAETMKVADGTANFNSGTGTNAAAVTFTGDGIVGVAANTTVTGALLTNTDLTGTLSLDDMSHWSGGVGDASASKGLAAINVVGNSATITGAVYAHEFSLASNTLNIDGGLTIGPAGVINTTLNSAADYGQIVKLSGASSLPAALGINPTVSGTTYIPVGTQFDIVQSAAGTGGDVITVTPTNPLYTFTAAPAVHGQATIELTGTPVTSAGNPVGTVLDTMPSSPDLDEVRTAINNLPTAAAVDDAESQLAPSTPSLAAPLVTFEGIRRFQTLLSSRLDGCRPTNGEPNENDPNCQGIEPRTGWWVKGFEYEGHQDARGTSTGYTARTFGTMLAFDRPIGENTRAGLGFGYARTKINGDKFDASTNFDTYQLMAYIAHERGNWFINGNVAVGWNEYSSMRHIMFAGVDRKARAKYSGQDYTAFASTGYHFYVKKFTVTPIVSLQYTRMHIGGYKENDAGDVNLKAKSQNYNFIESGLGVKVDRSFTSGGMKYIPEVHFNWFHKFSNPSLSQNTQYTAPGSSSFRTSGHRVDNDTYNVGGGLTLLSCECSERVWSLEAVYDHDWRNDGYRADQITMRLTSRF